MQQVQLPFMLEKALEQSETKFQRLTELMPMAVFCTDKDGLITFYNEKAAELWGRRPRLNDATELRFCGSWKMYDTNGTSLPHDQCPMGKAVRDKKCFRNQEILMERPDGTRINVLVNIDLLYSNDGELEGAINVFKDITEDKHRYEYIYRLAAIVESSDDAIISKTLNGIITSWNKGAEKIFGYKEDEIIGKHISILIPPLYIQEEALILEKICKGEKIEHYDTIRRAKDGRMLNISLAVSPVKNEAGQITGASKVARDITEKVKMDNQLRLYNEKLKEMNRFKDEFMAMASHELKTPLTVIKANLQLLDIKLKENPNTEFVSKTMKQVNKLSDLITDLLDVSKIQAGNLQLNFTEFDINKLLNETIETIQETSHSHKITFQSNGEELMVAADSARLEQVLTNVLTNAIKYSPGANEVIVTVKKEIGLIVIGVKDFGIGIPKQDIKKVFSRFYRVRGLASTFAGSGIGLYISHEIIKRQGGKMWVESKENEGSVFYFSIPAFR